MPSGGRKIMQDRIAPLGLGAIAEKLDAGERLTFADGVRLFECPDLLALGWLANREREKRHGGGPHYKLNKPGEKTHTGVARRPFFSFPRLRTGGAGAFTTS